MTKTKALFVALILFVGITVYKSSQNQPIEVRTNTVAPMENEATPTLTPFCDENIIQLFGSQDSSPLTTPELLGTVNTIEFQQLVNGPRPWQIRLLEGGYAHSDTIRQITQCVNGSLQTLAVSFSQPILVPDEHQANNEVADTSEETPPGTNETPPVQEEVRKEKKSLGKKILGLPGKGVNAIKNGIKDGKAQLKDPEKRKDLLLDGGRELAGFAPYGNIIQKAFPKKDKNGGGQQITVQGDCVNCTFPKDAKVKVEGRVLKRDKP